VIHRCDGEIRSPNLQASLTETGERLRRGDFVNQVKVDVENGRSIGFLYDDVVVPYLLK
jgi:hypothetical protein